MQEILATKGMAYGRISLLHTLATFNVGEVWTTTTNDVSITALRAAASRYGNLRGKRFSIRTKGSAITVTRTI